ncbi:12890_t:CDS:2, partial [Rhizophagus irregularis]
MELEQHLAYNVSGFVPFLPRNKYDKQAYITPEIEHGLVAERSSSSKKKTEEEPISFDFAVLVPIKGNDKRNRPIDPVDEYEHEYE